MIIVTSALKTNIQNLKIIHEKKSDYKVITVSMGLVCKNVDELDTKDSLYKVADDFLYQAKETGRN
ncbi:MAG: diguanylate cyclase, partial [Sulfurimonas sp.]|nr:diguanylate cyclase [Sulfurimonas sp.]